LTVRLVSFVFSFAPVATACLLPSLISDLIELVVEYYKGEKNLLVFFHPSSLNNVFFSLLSDDLSELASAVFDTVWNLGMNDIVATDYLVWRVTNSGPYTMEPFAAICSPQQLAVVHNALQSFPSPSSSSTSSSSSSSSVVLCSKLRFLPLNAVPSLENATEYLRSGVSSVDFLTLCFILEFPFLKSCG
jgi:hypothetical protein